MPKAQIAPFKRTLFHGMKGSEVESVQTWLSELNEYYNFYPYHNINPTGYYGTFTMSFVKKFQSFVELPPSGVFDFKTYQFVQARYGNMLHWYAKSAKVSY